jgi:3-hydroxybutyryl-CoA dehydrogenase
VSQPAETGASEGPPARPSDAFERLGIVGSGTVAVGLAACAAGRCADVVVWARSARSAERARERIDSSCEKLWRAEAAAAVRVVQELSELAGSTLAVEAVSEREPLKRELLARLHEKLAPEALIATTTSSLSVSGLAAASRRPAQFFGLHLFNPVHRMELVELCFPPEADDDTRARAAAFCESIGKTEVEVPDETGFIVNRLLFPYLFDAVRLLERSGLEPDQIDACMKLGASHPMGPLELLDLIGIDVAAAIGDAIYADTQDPDHRPPERLRRLAAEGKLGRKSGAGFYTYE